MTSLYVIMTMRAGCVSDFKEFQFIIDELSRTPP